MAIYNVRFRVRHRDDSTALLPVLRDAYDRRVEYDVEAETESDAVTTALVRAETEDGWDVVQVAWVEKKARA